MLVSPDELSRWLREGSASVFDCRFSLADKRAGRAAYERHHIPGAVYLDLEADLSAPASVEAGRHPLPNPLTFAIRMSEAGVANDKPVVFYDAGEGMAARGWWLMRYLGHKYVYLLNGGYEAWRQAGLEVSDAVVEPQPAELSVALQTEMIASEEDVEAVVAGMQPGTLVDARAASRYRGEHEPIDPKPGHIPGARNAPWTDGVGTDGLWLSADLQRRRMEGLGLVGDDAIHYCGSGVTACNNLFAMHLSGLGEGRLYPGSWSQWSGKPHHAVATGNEDT